MGLVCNKPHPPLFSFTMLAYHLFSFDLKSNSDIFLIGFDFITLYGKRFTIDVLAEAKTPM